MSIEFKLHVKMKLKLVFVLVVLLLANLLSVDFEREPMELIYSR